MTTKMELHTMSYEIPVDPNNKRSSKSKELTTREITQTSISELV